jgi:stalled ribosome alternative rescue factor ArfA
MQLVCINCLGAVQQCRRWRFRRASACVIAWLWSHAVRSRRERHHRGKGGGERERGENWSRSSDAASRSELVRGAGGSRTLHRLIE